MMVEFTKPEPLQGRKEERRESSGTPDAVFHECIRASVADAFMGRLSVESAVERIENLAVIRYGHFQ
jgi:hypothetical protein